jgi:hypothetical protein
MLLILSPVSIIAARRKQKRKVGEKKYVRNKGR